MFIYLTIKTVFIPLPFLFFLFPSLSLFFFYLSVGLFFILIKNKSQQSTKITWDIIAANIKFYNYHKISYSKSHFFFPFFFFLSFFLPFPFSLFLSFSLFSLFTFLSPSFPSNFSPSLPDFKCKGSLPSTCPPHIGYAPGIVIYQRVHMGVNEKSTLLSYWRYRNNGI